MRQKDARCAEYAKGKNNCHGIRQRQQQRYRV